MRRNAMRITSIELAGRIEPGKKLPRAFARVSRKIDDEHITVEIIMPGGERTHRVRADRDEDVRAMADCLQQALDGYDGSNSEFLEYYRELQRFAD
jgi:hypothetical protein